MKNRTQKILCCIILSLLLYSIIDVYGLGYTTNNSNYAQQSGTTGGWTNPDYTLASEENQCATNSAATNGNWRMFGFSIPTGSTINGILVTIKASQSSGSSTWTVGIRANESSPIQGNYTASVGSAACGAGQSTYTFGGLTDTWGASWTPAEVSNDLFSVNVATTGVATKRLNWIKVQVNYTAPWQTSTSTVTSTFNTTVTYNTTITTTTYNATQTTTITAATCIGGGSGSMAIFVAIVIGLIVVFVVAAKKR